LEYRKARMPNFKGMSKMTEVMVQKKIQIQNSTKRVIYLRNSNYAPSRPVHKAQSVAETRQRRGVVHRAGATTGYRELGEIPRTDARAGRSAIDSDPLGIAVNGE